MFIELHVYANSSLAGASSELRRVLLLRHVCPSASSPTWKTLLPLEGYLSNLVLGIFIKICRENCRLVTVEQNCRHFT